MASRPPHHLAFFSLAAVNERAQRVIEDQSNAHHASKLQDQTQALDIGFQIRGKLSTTLATIGRDVAADIYVEGFSISRIQCSFEIDFATGVIMFFDRSHSCTTQVSGDNAMPFEHGRVRKVVVRPDLNTIIGMGGENCDLVQFKLIWHPNAIQTAIVVKPYDKLSFKQLVNPRLAKTLDKSPTGQQSQQETRPHTRMRPKMRYVTVGTPLGAGQFGIVHKAIDVDSGKFVAMKKVKRPEEVSQQEAWERKLKREVEILCNVKHPHIIDYVASQGWEGPQLEIFTDLMDGTLEALIEGGADNVPIANVVCPQMLEALDYLAYKNIIHRDVKPDNILYKEYPNNAYHFQLIDFGLSNCAITTTTFAGSRLYMAPEMFSEIAYSSKVDIWSLFVTIWWILDPEFRRREFNSERDVWNLVFSASKKGVVSQIQEMAIVNPELRASAAQMLVKCFGGKGLSSPRYQVPVLPNAAPPAATAFTAQL